jgi:hypothetical protein
MARAYAIANYKKPTVWALGLVFIGIVGCNIVRYGMLSHFVLLAYRFMMIVFYDNE